MKGTGRVLRGGRLVKTARGVVSLAAVVGVGLVAQGAVAQELECETTPTTGFEICPVEWENPIQDSWGLGVAAVTPDGRIVVGDAGFGSHSRPFRAEVGADTISVLPTLNDEISFGRTIGYAYDITADGEVVVGSTWDETRDTLDSAVRWVRRIVGGQEQYTIERLSPVASEFGSSARAVSQDGSIIVGVARLSEDSQSKAVLWFDNGDALPIRVVLQEPDEDLSSAAIDVSSSGNVIVGSSGNDAVRWVASGPMFDGLQSYGIQSLGQLDYPEWSSWQTFATAVSGNGAAVVGYSGGQAFRWIDGGSRGDSTNPEMEALVFHT